MNQKAIHKPSAQHVLDEDYYKRIEAIQYLSHDDGKKIDDINSADATFIRRNGPVQRQPQYIALTEDYKTKKIPLVLEQKILKQFEPS